MKMHRCLFAVLLLLSGGVVLPLSAATNSPPAAEVHISESNLQPEAPVYTINYPGGSVRNFFGFLRTNGFAGDTILFVGDADNLRLPDFSVQRVRLSEIGRSLEFVAEGQLMVEVVERSATSGDANIWRVRVGAPREANAFRTRACALPRLFTAKDGTDRVGRIVDLSKAYMDQFMQRFSGNNQASLGNTVILDAEKIVVATGTEGYVEAITSALEAAERAAAAEPPEKQKY